MTSTRLSVPDISCDACKDAIENALGNVPGVRAVDVNIAAGTVDVAFEAPADLGAVRAAIDGQGYDVTDAEPSHRQERP